MKRFLRFILFLSLISWLGGIIFFSFVVAPSVFAVLTPVPGGLHLAGNIVNETLGALQWIGVACGVVFLAASTALLKKLHSAQNFLVVLMMLLAGIFLFGIRPRMEELRSSAPAIEKAPPDTQSRFNKLHQASVAVEGVTLLLGLGVAWLVAKERE